MSDLAKDIEILKSIQNCIRANMLNLESEELQNKDLRDIKAIENILKELENWKKIAEKLADECTMFKKIQEIDLDNEYSNGLVYMTKEEVLYWARKEVEK